MKKVYSIFILIFMVATIQAQEFAEVDKSVLDAAYFPAKAAMRTFAKTPAEKVAAAPKMRVLYSRPLVKGRTIFGDLVKYNEPWRVGANESTEVLFMTDAIFGDTPVKAGRYSIIAVPTKKSWKIYLNAETDGWGNYSYNPEWNVAEYNAKTQKSNSAIEALSIALYEKSPDVAHMKIGWANTFVEIPIKF